MEISPEWQNLISEIIASPGVVMVVGGVDVGKTNFCLQLAWAGHDAGIPTAVVDSDIGQSEIGAPGTIGMSIVDKPIESLSDLETQAPLFRRRHEPGRAYDGVRDWREEDGGRGH